MKLGKVTSKKALGIFDAKTKENFRHNEIIKFAAEYWANLIMNAGKNQINFEMGNDIILLSERDIEKFKKSFINYISKIFCDDENGIMLWTSNGEYFDRVGIDAYLNEIMKNCNLSPTCLPSEISMWIYSDKIDIEDDYQRETIYTAQDKKVK